MRNDLLSALRLIRSHPWFSTAIVVTLAFGIGINTTIFTLANAVLFKPVPLPNGDRIVAIAGTHPSNKKGHLSLSYPDFRDLQEQCATMESIEGVRMYSAIISEEGVAPERLNVADVTNGLFPMLGVAPVAGRLFREDDFSPSSDRPILIAKSVWENRYGSDPNIEGRLVRFNGQPGRIVGVMPDTFRFPDNQFAWTPYIPDASSEDRSNRQLQTFGVRKQGIDIEQADREIALLAANLAQSFPDTNKDRGAHALTFHERYNGGPIRILFLAMMGATGFVLMIACSNVANMLMGRAIGRRQEMSIRAALGANRRQIVRQLLIESVSLSVIGGGLGLAITAVGVHLFDQASQNVGKPYWILFELDYRVFAYFALVSIGSGLLFGLAPALRATKVDLNETLKEGARSSDTRSAGRLSGALVILQFAMTLTLLTCAGLLLKSFFAAQNLNDFIPADKILTATIALPEGKGDRYENPADRRLFYQNLMQRLATLPGVSNYAITSHLPGLGAATRPVAIDGQPTDDPENPPKVSFLVQTPGYFSSIGLPIIAGRGFEESDNELAANVAVASQTFVNTYWPGETGIGKRFQFPEDNEPDKWITIIGVVGDITQQPRSTDSYPLVYVCEYQRPWGYMSVMLRSQGDPMALAPALKDAVQTLDQDLPVFNFRTLLEAKKSNYWFLNIFGTLFLAFAIIGLAMASTGIYATVAQSTARRVREIGIRMALGAAPSRVLRLIARRGTLQMVAGLTLGLGVAFSSTHFLSDSILFQVSPRDPSVFTISCGILVAIGLLASWLPARRAIRIDPAKTLRDQ